MDEGKPSQHPANPKPASGALKDKTVPASDARAYWKQINDEGVQVGRPDRAGNPGRSARARQRAGKIRRLTAASRTA